MSEITEADGRKRILLGQLQEMKENVENLQSSILTMHGWSRSYNFPDARCRWVKDIRGETLVADVEAAMEIEEAIVEWT